MLRVPGKPTSSSKYSSSHGALAGKNTRPFSNRVAAGMQAHDLVGARRRFVLDDRSDAIVLQILNELSARALVLDHDLSRVKPSRLGHDRALEIRVVETSAEHVDQVIILPIDAPGGAD